MTLNQYQHRPTVCEIDLDALTQNYNLIRNMVHQKSKVLTVVKANAYGHGAVEVSKRLEHLGVDYLGVAILEEAIFLREFGIKTPIIILGGIFKGQEEAIFDHDLIPVVYNLSTIHNLDMEAKRRGVSGKVHIKIDTGMGRIGIQTEDLKAFFEGAKGLESIDVEGILTHYASADAPEDNSALSFTRLQTNKFIKAIEVVEGIIGDIPLKHAANSAAIFGFPDSHFNLVRPGIMLYGSSPSPDMARPEGLKQVMSLKTRIMETKSVKKGFRVSYGGTWEAPGDAKIAVLPIGYADGYNRKLSNLGEVIVRGTRVPVAGKVCMDMTMIDVTGINGVEAGDEVSLFGGNEPNAVTIDEVAEKIGTIPYEVMCSISSRVPKVYKG